MIRVQSKSPTSRTLRRVYHRTLRPFKRLYWYLMRPAVQGTKVVVECEGKFLLVRLSYGHGEFTYPGGSVDRGESFVDGAARELYEEAGIRTVPEELVLIGEYHTDYQYRQVHIQVFYCSVQSQDVLIDGDEIVEAQWAAPNELPVNTVKSVGLIYTHYVEKFKNWVR